MKRFDQAAITQRRIKYLKQYPDFAGIQEDGSIVQMIEADAEAEAELARYLEYLLQELKWDTSRNLSSVKHIAKLVGKKLLRKHSAVGSLIISHTDPEGVNRMAKLGTSNLDINCISNYDDGSKDESMVESMYQNALTPWLSSSSYSVEVGDIFSTLSGTTFICAERKSIKHWASTWSSIEKDPSLSKSFLSMGGWEGYKYLVVPVVQGKLMNVPLGRSDNTACQVFTIQELNVEAADNYYTKQFCKVIVKVGNEEQVWTEVPHLGKCTATDRVFEINIKDDLSGTTIQFGDGINGAIPPDDAQLNFHYLHTDGAAGNVNDLYTFNPAINFQNPDKSVPTNADYPNLQVNCQNVWAITGGKDLETIKEFKSNAEIAYAKNYEILHTYNELLANIDTVSPIPLIKAKVKEFNETEIINQTTVYRKSIGVTGLSTGLLPLNNLEKTLFETSVNHTINDKVLSNKLIKYVEPPLIKIDSHVEFEFKSSQVDPEGQAAEIKTYLNGLLGRTCIDSMDAYHKSTLSQECGNYRNDIYNINTTDLLTFDVKDVYSTKIGVATGGDNYIIFNFESPYMDEDTLSNEGYCCKTNEDGLSIVGVFNLNVGNNASTYIVQDNGKGFSTSVNKAPTNVSSVTQDYYANEEDNQRFFIKTTRKPKHTFSEIELTKPSDAQSSVNPEDVNEVYFYFEPTATRVKANLILPTETLSKSLGFNSAVSATRILSLLQSSLDSHTASITLSVAPACPTVKGEWNTVMYYDNIDVKPKG